MPGNRPVFENVNQEIKTDEPTARELLADILAVLESIADRLEYAPIGAFTVPQASPFGRYRLLLEALAAALADYDAPFEVAEVVAWAQNDHAVDQQLKTLNLRTTAALGARFRSLNGHWIGDLRVVRDGEAWRLERRT